MKITAITTPATAIIYNHKTNYVSGMIGLRMTDGTGNVKQQQTQKLET